MKYITLNPHNLVDCIVDTDTNPNYELTGKEIEITDEQWDVFYSFDDPFRNYEWFQGDWRELSEAAKQRIYWLDYRKEAYGSIGQQLEFITENGLEAWQARVADIKEKYKHPVYLAEDRDPEVT